MKRHLLVLLSTVLFTSLQLNLYSQFTNVQLPLPKKAKYLYSQVEPSIFINPNNTDEIIAGTVMNDYYWSTDGGYSWESRSIKSKYGVNGDPCMLIDQLGRYYYFHLSNIKGVSLIGGIVSQYSTSIDGKFKKKYQGHTVANNKYHDKHWVALNPTKNTIYMSWTQFDAYDSENPNDMSHILFSKTDDGGVTWSEAVQISKVGGDCKDNDLTAEGAVPAVGPNGEIYVVWARNDSLWINVSLDDGTTWFAKEQFVIEQPQGWVIDIPGIYRCNGLPVTACDVSTAQTKGNLYVNWADQLNGTDNTDIWLVKSSDGGKTWSDRIKVNTDEGESHQFLTWMTIDQTTGYLYFVFYDRRNTKGRDTDVYLAVSRDGGESIENYKISESSFSPNPKIFFGDYTNISVYDGVIRPIWTRLHNNHITVHTAIIDQKRLDRN